MPLRALIFDVDGTLAHTEREGHLPACNEAFARLGYPVRWTWEEFKPMLPIPGNAQRMRAALGRLGEAFPPEEIEARVKALVELKRRLYVEEYDVPRLLAALCLTPAQGGVEPCSTRAGVSGLGQGGAC